MMKIKLTISAKYFVFSYFFWCVACYSSKQPYGTFEKQTYTLDSTISVLELKKGHKTVAVCVVYDEAQVTQIQVFDESYNAEITEYAGRFEFGLFAFYCFGCHSIEFFQDSVRREQILPSSIKKLNCVLKESDEYGNMYGRLRPQLSDIEIELISKYIRRHRSDE